VKYVGSRVTVLLANGDLYLGANSLELLGHNAGSMFIGDG
jgi:hypothetical protein